MNKLKIWTLAIAAISLTIVGCKKEDTDDNNKPPQKVGIQGEWQSSGADVAPILVVLFGTDSIYANFKTDMSYVLEQYDTTGAKLTLTGVYSQTESGIGSIYDIVVNQSSPATLESAGIFEITGNTMQYEIVQTSPDIGAIPPTAAGGFGSTNGGALGMANVQVYKKVE